MAETNASNSVRVLSLNCWGLKYISKHRVARLNEIALRIARASPAHDIVALQEFWVYSDYLNLRQKTSAVLPYGKFYFSGAIGGGLVILSKWPIESSTMYRYPLNGRPTAFWRGDWYVGKGVASASIRHPSGRLIEVFNTHLHAPYESINDTYLCHRTAQAWEIAKLMRGAAQRGSTVIGAGDFNMIPSSLAHRLIATHGLVSDSWLSFYPSTPVVAPPKSTAKHNIEELGVTCDSVLNTWRMETPMLPSPETQDPRAKRLDYVFHSPSTSAVLEVVVGMTEPMSMPTQTKGHGGAGGYSTLSDHFSVEVWLSLEPSKEQQRALSEVVGGGVPVPVPVLVDVVGENRAEETLLGMQSGDWGRCLPVSVVDEVLALAKTYTRRQEGEYFWRLLHFWVSVPVIVGCQVAVWWSPHNAVAFALMLVAWIVAVTGVMDGLIGFLFMGSELRALKEFEEEMRMYRQLAVTNAPKQGSPPGNGAGNDFYKNGSHNGSGQLLL